MIERLKEALTCLRLPAMPEEQQIHEAIENELKRHEIEFIHEAKLGPGCRIDFLCGNVGIEVKKSRPQAAALKKQVSRYLAFDELQALFVVTQRPCVLPDEIHGKPVYQFSIDRLWGVALP